MVPPSGGAEGVGAFDISVVVVYIPSAVEDSFFYKNEGGNDVFQTNESLHFCFAHQNQL